MLRHTKMAYLQKQEASSKKFTDLVAWQKAHSLVLSIYKITKEFPKEEQFGLTSQMRRAAVSIASNIAERFSRRSNADKAHLYTMAHGSLAEVQNQLLIGRDVNYIKPEAFQKLADIAVDVHKLLTGLIKATKETA